MNATPAVEKVGSELLGVVWAKSWKLAFLASHRALICD
jgi:hypothetical protein